MVGTQNTGVLATPNVPLNVQAHGGLFWNMLSSVTPSNTTTQAAAASA